jgi:hypothetical protein
VIGPTGDNLEKKTQTTKTNFSPNQERDSKEKGKDHERKKKKTYQKMKLIGVRNEK